MQQTKIASGERVLLLEEFIPYRLARVAEAVSVDFASLYRSRYGLTRPEWRVFATIGQFSETTATRIGCHSAMHKTKVSRAITGLERRNWITRTTDTRDRRIEQVKLTPEGRRRYKELVTIAQHFERSLIERLGDDNFKSLCLALNALDRIFDDGETGKRRHTD